MKRLIVASALCLFVAYPAIANDDKKDEPEYKVTISVTYNAVSPDKAASLVKEITKSHAEACDVSVEVSKYNDRIVTGNTFYNTTVTSE